MTELLTAAQMRAIEEAAIASGEVTGLELMERAGRGVVEAVFEEWPELAAAPHRAVVLCGPGNNGGDGFVVARLLKEWGWEVEVFLYGEPDKLPPDARVNYERWGGEVHPFSDEDFEDGFDFGDLLVDALLGIGVSRPVTFCATLCHAVEDIVEYDDASTKVVSIDVPTGLNADTGGVFPIDDAAPPHVILPHLSVSFHSAKVGHYVGEGPGVTRKLVIKGIGLSSHRDPGTRSRKALIDLCGDNKLGRFVCVKQTRARLAARLFKEAVGHKYQKGHALVLTGSPGKTGAARLAARGALRIGAGLVTLGVPGAAQMEVASQVTAIMLKRAGTEEEVASVLEDKRINAVCLGPGLGLERAKGLVETVLGGLEPRPTVLDADALTAFEGEPEALFGMLREYCVLTPHGGEFARLFPGIAERLNEVPTKGPAYSKVDATREAAKRAGCVVLFKGPDTVIAAPDGRCSINSAHYERAAPWLATAGSGDVLAGFITGLLARGFGAMQAAETAAWLHVECARAFGPGLIAEDLPEALPGVLRDLGV